MNLDADSPASRQGPTAQDSARNDNQARNLHPCPISNVYPSPPWHPSKSDPYGLRISPQQQQQQQQQHQHQLMSAHRGVHSPPYPISRTGSTDSAGGGGYQAGSSPVYYGENANSAAKPFQPEGSRTSIGGSSALPPSMLVSSAAALSAAVHSHQRTQSWSSSTRYSSQHLCSLNPAQVQRFPSFGSSMHTALSGEAYYYSYVARLRRIRATAWCERGQREETEEEKRKRKASKGKIQSKSSIKPVSLYSNDYRATSLIPAHHPRNLPPRLSATEFADFGTYEDDSGSATLSASTDRFPLVTTRRSPSTLEHQPLTGVNLRRNYSTGSAWAITAASVPFYGIEGNIDEEEDDECEDSMSHDLGRLKLYGHLTIANPDCTSSETEEENKSR